MHVGMHLHMHVHIYTDKCDCVTCRVNVSHRTSVFMKVVSIMGICMYVYTHIHKYTYMCIYICICVGGVAM